MSKRGFAHLLAVTLAKACIWAMAKGKPKHASGNLFRKGRMASANAGNKRLTASGFAMSLATTGCGVFLLHRNMWQVFLFLGVPFGQP